MLARIEVWYGKFGYLTRTDESGNLERYFLPLGEIKFLGVEKPNSWDWVAFLPGVPLGRILKNGRPACPVAKYASVFASKEEAQSADKLIQLGSSRKSGGAQ